MDFKILTLPTNFTEEAKFNRLKILYHHRIASRDGQYIHLSAIVRELKNEGHEVYLTGPDLAESNGMGGQKEWVHFLKRNIPNLAYELIEFSYCFFDFFKLFLTIKRYKPDFIYERANLFFVSGVWASRLLKLPLILEVNAPLYEERSKYDGISLKLFARWSENYVWKHADYLLPVTNVLADIIKDRVSPKNIVVIHNGASAKDLSIKVQAEDMRKRLSLVDKVIIGFVGFVRNWHKLDRIIDFIEARNEKNLCLLVVGEGPDCQNLMDYASRKGLSDKLIMAGVVQRDMMASYINIFDVAIQSAVTEYASPLKLFEYLYLSRVIVAPDMDNIKEIIEHGKNGYLFDDKDKQSLFSALEKALGSNNKTISENAFKTIKEKNFLWNENAKKIVNIYRKIKEHY